MSIIVMVKCLNYKESYSANFNWCTNKHNAEVDACKNKILRRAEQKIVKSYDI